MIRNLKVLALSVLALAAFGALAAFAQAEPTFTNNLEGEGEVTYKIAKDDEGGKNPTTGHIVLEIRKADGTGVRALTCSELTGDATVAADERKDITFSTPKFGGCVFFGAAVTVENKGCNFTFTSDGQLHILDDTKVLLCEEGQSPIFFKHPTLTCEVEIFRQTLSGIKYHNLVGGTVTVEANNIPFEYNATGAGCPYGTTKNGVITTANVIFSATKVGTEELVEVSWDE